MSRVRHILMPDGKQIWFDTHKNSDKASKEQLELLVSIMDSSDDTLDDILDADYTQGEIILKLRELLGQGGIPPEVIKKRERWRKARSRAPKCRMCDKEGDSTKHHFINKWILRELRHYEKLWADRSKNCIPLCIDCHRDIHSRTTGAHSIAPYLNETEKAFAQLALDTLAQERPTVTQLLLRGNQAVYESQLLRDWENGRFEPALEAVAEFARDSIVVDGKLAVAM